MGLTLPRQQLLNDVCKHWNIFLVPFKVQISMVAPTKGKLAMKHIV